MRRASFLGLAGILLATTMAGCVVEVAIPQDTIDSCTDPVGAQAACNAGALEYAGCPCFAPGNDTAYTISYASGGSWSVSFSCDMTVTSCHFTGRVIAQNGASIMNPVGTDYVWNGSTYVPTSYQPIAVSADEVDFDQTMSWDPTAAEYKTLQFTSTGADYVEFDMGINGDYSGAGIRYVSGAQVLSPSGNPVVLYPTSP